MKTKLKGFTLIEMIIVVALFGLIMAGALSLLQPVNRVYKDALEYVGARGAIDNMRSYTEDNLKYANRLAVFTNISDINSLDLTKLGIDSSNISDESKSDGVITAVEFMRDRYLLGPQVYTFGTVTYKNYNENESDIHIIKIDNPDENEDLEAIDINSSINRGALSMQVYSGGVLDASKSKEYVPVFYKEYSFDLSLGEEILAEGEIKDESGAIIHRYKQYKNFNPKNFATTLKIYKNKRENGVYNSIYTQIESVVTFALVNIISSSGDIKLETIDCTKNYNSTLTIEEQVSNKNTLSPPRYSFYQGDADNNDIYLVFTKPPKL